MIKINYSKSIVDAVIRLEKDFNLKKKIISNGLKLVKNFTSDYQGKLIYENSVKFFEY